MPRVTKAAQISVIVLFMMMAAFEGCRLDGVE